MTAVLILTGLLLGMLATEAILNRKSLQRIPVRIHVNGTRGKSSVTRYITAALNDSGKPAMGKITGDFPLFILPGRITTPVKRRGPARVNEQFRVIRKAARKNMYSLVLECMSIDPLLQQIESRFYRPDLYVLCNIKDDHREKMGATREERIAALCGAIPAGCVVVSNDVENLEAIGREAEKKNSALVVPERISQKVRDALPFGVFASNVELAVEVAVLCGISRVQALQSVLNVAAEDKPGLYDLSGDGELLFLDGLKVNDPDSATEFLDYWLGTLEVKGGVACIFNTRADRPLRTDSFVEWLVRQKDLFRVVLIAGDHKERAFRKLKARKTEMDVRKIRSSAIRKLPRLLPDEYPGLSLIVGIGNIHGTGRAILHAFKNAV